MQETTISLMQLPVGMKFNPTDYELVCYYLLNKVIGHPLPCDVVKECDLYGDMEPWEIWERFGGSMLESDKDIFFFTQLKKKTSNGSRIERRVGTSGGSWHGEDSGKKFKAKGVDDHGYVAWTQRRFRYVNPKSKKQCGQWLMQEYSLDQSFLSTPTSTVLCRIRRNEKKRKISEMDLGLGEIVDQYCGHESKRLNLEQQQPQVENEGQIEYEEISGDNMATSSWTNYDLNQLVGLSSDIDELLNDPELMNDEEENDDDNFNSFFSLPADMPQDSADATLQWAFDNAREAGAFYNSQSVLFPVQTC